MAKTKKIKYAIEQMVTVPIYYTDEDIEELIARFAKDNNYIWCKEDEDLLILD